MRARLGDQPWSSCLGRYLEEGAKILQLTIMFRAGQEPLHRGKDHRGQSHWINRCYAAPPSKRLEAHYKCAIKKGCLAGGFLVAFMEIRSYIGYTDVIRLSSGCLVLVWQPMCVNSVSSFLSVPKLYSTFFLEIHTRVLLNRIITWDEAVSFRYSVICQSSWRIFQYAPRAWP